MTIRNFVQLSLVRWWRISLPIQSSPLGSPKPYKLEISRCFESRATAFLPLAYSSHERLKSTDPSSRFWITVQGPMHFANTGRRWFAGAIMCNPLSGEFISEQSLGSALTMFSYCISTLSSSSKSCAVECTPSSAEPEPRTALSAFVLICECGWERGKMMRWKFNYNPAFCAIFYILCCCGFTEAVCR